MTEATNKPKQMAAYDKFEITSADRFSKYAQQAAVEAETKEYPMIVRLINNDILDEMLDPILPDRPWLYPISEVDEEISSYLADQIPVEVTV